MNRYFRPDFLASKDPSSVGSIFRFSVKDGSHNGTKCLVVRADAIKPERAADTIHYLDPSNFLVLAVERTRTFRSSTRRFEPLRELIKVSYGPPEPDTGLPFPIKVKGQFVTTDGTRYPAVDVTFTEYRRHTPKPDELDVEKVLGVKKPSIPPRPPLPPEGTYLDPGQPAPPNDCA